MRPEGGLAPPSGFIHSASDLEPAGKTQRHMMSFIGKRSLASAVSLVGLIVLVFFLSRLTGDPTSLYLPLDAPLESREQFREIHGLNDPLIVQFGRYVWDLLHFDFGDSLRKARPALDVVLEAFPWTLMLAAITMALVTSLGHRHRLARRLQGRRLLRPALLDPLADRRQRAGLLDGDRRHLLLLRQPRLAADLGHRHRLALDPADRRAVRPALRPHPAGGARLDDHRASSAYVKTARAKGVKDRPIIFVHALRNAMLPVITVIGDQAAGMLNGAVVVETIFGFPGIGKLMIDSILQRDFTVVLAAIMVTALAIFMMNLLIDLAYAVLDPRIRI